MAGTNKTGIYVTQNNLKTQIIPCAKTPLPEVNFISCVHCMQTSEVKILKASSAVWSSWYRLRHTKTVCIYKASFRVIIFSVVKRGSALRIKASTFDPSYKRIGQKEFKS